MKKYFSFFRMRFIMGLQYRTAALAGIITQFFWGAMEILIFMAFYRTDAAAFPMSMEATSSYIWLQQAFLAFFGAWMMEYEIFETISNGNIAYELCRPIDIYDMWYARNVATRLSRAVLRCFPILLVAALLPKPYGISAPVDLGHFVLFLFTLILGLAVMVSLCMLIYVLTFFTISAQGLRKLFSLTVEFFAGAVIPLPFFPDKVRRFMELLPFASMQNVPLRIYSGSMSGAEMRTAIMLQVCWLIVLTAVGRGLCHVAVKKVTVQGG